MALKSNLIPLGIIANKDITAIFARTTNVLKSKFVLVWSNDELHFTSPVYEATITLQNKKKENPKYCSNFQFTRGIDGLIATYIRTIGRNKTRVIAMSMDLYAWTVKHEMPLASEDVSIAYLGGPKNKYALYSGGLFATVAVSKDLHEWVKSSLLLFTSREEHFDKHPFKILGNVMTKSGLLVFYDASYANGKMHMLQLGGVMFSKENPDQIIWRSDKPLWTSLIHENYGHNLYVLGAIARNKKASVYWASEDGSIISSSILIPSIAPPDMPAAKREKLYLAKHHKNPIIKPDGEHTWESEAVFNPAAVYDNGKIHLFYRAIGKNGISVLGYASSKNGLHFENRLNYPVYEPPMGYEMPDSDTKKELQRYNPLRYISGGGWSGYEDPRAIRIEDRVYLIYLSFGGWNSMRLALTSISAEDLNNEEWNWTAPNFISPPGEIHKNWVLFPEKVNGKFALLHAVSPHILIHYVDTLESFDGKNFIESIPPHGGRKDYWDSKVRGVGPPPLKTKLGWLIFYHANDTREPHKYKLGAMILDKNDPTKILYRTSQPILVPDMHYENDGKPGIVYASGAIIKDDRLFVYYGGGDKVVCVASAQLDTFLESVKKDAVISLT